MTIASEAIEARDLRPAITKLSAEKIQALLAELTTEANKINRGVRELANDAAVEIGGTDRYIEIADSTTGVKAITTGSDVFAGQEVMLKLLACTGNSYTLATQPGTLTFDAAAEAATIIRNEDNDAWLVPRLEGATIA